MNILNISETIGVTVLIGGGKNEDTAEAMSKTPLVIVSPVSTDDISSKSTDWNLDAAFKTNPVPSAVFDNLSVFAMPLTPLLTLSA